MPDEKNLTQREIGAALGLTQSAISYQVKRGMPTTSIAAARAFIAERKQRASRKEQALFANLQRPLETAPEVADAMTAVRDLRQQVSNEARNIEQADKQIDEAISKNDQESITQWSMVRNTSRRTHATLIPTLVATEEKLVRLQKHRGELIKVDSAKELVTKVLSPFLIYLRKLPDHARTASEKDLLVSLAEGGLQILAGTSQELAEAARAELGRMVKANGHTA